MIMKIVEDYIMLQNNGSSRQPPGCVYVAFKALNLRKKQVGRFVFICQTKYKEIT